MSLSLIEVSFERETTCIGRNGSFKAVALELFRQDRNADDCVIDLQPRTSRGNPANCHIEIPVEAVPSIVAALNKLIADAQDGKDKKKRPHSPRRKP